MAGDGAFRCPGPTSSAGRIVETTGGADKRFRMCCRSPAMEGDTRFHPGFHDRRGGKTALVEGAGDGRDSQTVKIGTRADRKPVYARQGISGMIRPTNCCKTTDPETTIYIKDVLEGAKIRRPRRCRLTVRRQRQDEMTSFDAAGITIHIAMRGNGRHSARDTKPFLETGGDEQP